jgi:acetoin utilization protein AcuB
MAPKRSTIRDFMTPQPHTIGAAETMRSAHLLMGALGVRHLPVLAGQEVVGMISLREVEISEAVDAVSHDLARVADVMSEPAFIVAPGAALARVAEQMATRKLGSAVVVDGNRVVGIFTTVDALWALAEMSREHDAVSGAMAGARN